MRRTERNRGQKKCYIDSSDDEGELRVKSPFSPELPNDEEFDPRHVKDTVEMSSGSSDDEAVDENGDNELKSAEKHSKLDLSADESSSESDIGDYLRRPDEIDLGSSFFKEAKPREVETPFSQIERSILSGVNSSLGDSDSEIEEKPPDEGVPSTSSIRVPPRVNFEQLNAYAKKIEEAKLHVEKYLTKKKLVERKDDISSLLTMGERDENQADGIDVLRLCGKALRSSDFESCSDSEEDWEEVAEDQQPQVSELISKGGVEITVRMPDVIRKKKGVDLLAAMKRRLNRIRKENQVYVHKVHLLCWIAHGNYINAALSKETVLATALSLLPSQQSYPSDRTDFKYLEQILAWYRITVIVVGKKLPKDRTLDESLVAQLGKREAFNEKMFVYLFTCILRSLGIQCRLVFSLQLVPLRPPVTELYSLASKDSKIDAVKNTKDKAVKSKDITKNKKVIGKDVNKVTTGDGKEKEKIANRKGSIKQKEENLNLDRNSVKGKISRKKNVKEAESKSKSSTADFKQTTMKQMALDEDITVQKDGKLKVYENEKKVNPRKRSTSTTTSKDAVKADSIIRKRSIGAVSRCQSVPQELGSTSEEKIGASKLMTVGNKSSSKAAAGNKEEKPTTSRTRSRKENADKKNANEDAAGNSNNKEAKGRKQVETDYDKKITSEGVNVKVPGNSEKNEAGERNTRSKRCQKEYYETSFKSKPTEFDKILNVQKDETLMNSPFDLATVEQSDKESRTKLLLENRVVHGDRKSRATKKSMVVKQLDDYISQMENLETPKDPKQKVVKNDDEAMHLSRLKLLIPKINEDLIDDDPMLDRDSWRRLKSLSPCILKETASVEDAKPRSKSTEPLGEVKRRKKSVDEKKPRPPKRKRLHVYRIPIKEKAKVKIEVPQVDGIFDSSSDENLWSSDESLCCFVSVPQLDGVDDDIAATSNKNHAQKNLKSQKRCFSKLHPKRSKAVSKNEDVSSEDEFSESCTVGKKNGDSFKYSQTSTSQTSSVRLKRYPESSEEERLVVDVKKFKVDVEHSQTSSDHNESQNSRVILKKSSGNFSKSGVHVNALKKSSAVGKPNGYTTQLSTTFNDSKERQVKRICSLENPQATEKLEAHRRVNLKKLDPESSSSRTSNQVSTKKHCLSDSSVIFKQKQSGDVRDDIVNLIKGRITERKHVGRKCNRSLTVEDSDSDFAPSPVFRKSSEGKVVKVKRRVPPRTVVQKELLEEELTGKVKKQGNDVWIEVFLEAEEKWISVDVVNGQVHCVKELFSRATRPISYIFSWDNNNRVKDVTKRYCANCNTVMRKLRVDQKWLDYSLNPYAGKQTVWDKEEDEHLARQQLDQPLPTTITEYKDHPLYVLKRHLLKFQAIYPPDAIILGFIRKEPVYSRDCVYTLHSRDIWLKHAKVVKPGETPYKIVKARPKFDKLSNTMITDQPLEIFGEWQIEDYVPPTAENGIVPRNAWGNVELFKACMLPKRTAHLQLPGLNKVARKLNVDCAPAVVGFDFHSGWSHPTFDGFVVCEEHVDALIAAWYQEQEEMEKREKEKYEKRVYGNWKKLIKGLMIRERLKLRYDFGGETSKEAFEEKPKPKGPRFILKKKK